MTRAAPTRPQADAHHPTVLVVADAALAERLTARGVSAVHVPDTLQAIAMLAPRGRTAAGGASAGDGRPEPNRDCPAVVMPLEQLGRAPEPTLRAVHQVAPQARLILLAEPADEPDAMRAVRLGASDYHIHPLNLDQLLASLQAAGAAGDDADLDTAERPEAGSTAGAPFPAGEAGTTGAADATRAASPAMDPGPFDDPPAGQTPLDDPALCDALLDDLLHDRSLRPRLLRHLSEQAGGDVQLVEQPPMRHAGDAVAVRANGHHFGYLVSDTTPAIELADHAPRLARWLAVEQRLVGLKELTYKDPLTGAWSRRYFDKAFRSILHHAADHRFRVTLLLFDIDDFKHYNDTYGHPAGDEILIQCARLMRSVVRKHDVVARIGGDEFAVLFWDAEGPRKPNSEHPHSIRRAAARFQRAICEHRFPKLGDCAPGTLTISGGLASFPWDGRTPDDLVAVADRALLASKKQGKNVITFGDGAERLCGDEADNTDGHGANGA